MSDPIYGYDVSEHQPGFDHAQAYGEGYRFVMARTSQGLYRDKHFTDHMKAIRKTKLLFAAYHYVWTSPAHEQAATVADMIGDTTVPVMLDSENGSSTEGQNWDVAQALRKLGYRVVLNYLPEWYWSQIGKPKIRLGPLWSSKYVTGTGFGSALYPKVPASYWDGYGGQDVAILQFTSKAKIAGRIVDASAFRGSMAEVEALFGGKTASTPSKPAPAPPAATGSSIDPTLDKIRTPYGQKGAMWSKGYHTGDDWHRNAGQAEIGDPIVAVADGTVIYAGDARTDGGQGWGPAFGKHVLIKWDQHGRTSIDAHMNSIVAKEGQHVKAGDLIGHKGMTGNVTGPHDHHEQHTGTRWTDPDVKPIYPGRTVQTPTPAPAPSAPSAPAPIIEEELDVAEQLPGKHRTKPQTIPPTKNGKIKTLMLENSGDVTWAFGAGRYTVAAYIRFKGADPGDELVVRGLIVDTDKTGKVAHMSKMPDVGKTGSDGKTFAQFDLRWHAAEPKAGLTRRMRIGVENYSGHDITVTEVITYIWKAPL